ncbi:MAG: DUF4861 family protein [Reichenbachiella sp.]
MRNSIIFFVFVLFVSCSDSSERGAFKVINTLDLDRENETVRIPKAWIDLNKDEILENIGVLDENGTLQLLQYVDEDQNGSKDAILFQPKVLANSQSSYSLKKLMEQEENPSSQNECFSRFVPERTDDYTWENDKVAFRMFGPVAQKMKEEGIAGGTLTSGIDCWLKRVEYPIINKWYKEHESNPGAYHEDTGEGFDNFHVGVSRGCGGIAVLRDGAYFTSKNFTSYQTTDNGYIRTAFELDYAPWPVGDDQMIKSLKKISLDKGSQLSRIEVAVEGVDVISAGLTLHENDGEVNVDSLGGWISYWQPHGDNFLGMAIIASPGTFLGYDKVVTEQPDLSHAYMHLAVKDGESIYYSGFFWMKSRQFEGRKEWEAYLSKYAKQLANPLTISQIN